MRGAFGALLKELRVKNGHTMREFCAKHGFDPGNYSRIERGLFAPPGPEKIEEYAKALGVETGSTDYTTLLDRAAVDRGELPQDLLSDEQLVAELPLVFRTLRGQRLDGDQLDRLAAIIRKR